MVVRAILSLVVLASGCADECLTSESQCEGTRTFERCVQTDGFPGDHWGDPEACPSGTACVDVLDSRGGRRAAVCTSSPEPDPRCPTGMDGGSGYLDTCTDQGPQLRCYYSYSREIACDHGCRNAPDGLHGACVP